VQYTKPFEAAGAQPLSSTGGVQNSMEAVQDTRDDANHCSLTMERASAAKHGRFPPGPRRVAKAGMEILQPDRRVSIEQAGQVLWRLTPLM